MERFIQDITKKAGDAALKKFGKFGVHYLKSEHRGDAVTKADLLADRLIVTAVRKMYPSHGIISEESGKVRENADHVWIVDPIDGTFNFATSVPLFGVMVALAHKGRVVLSAIYLPATKEFFFAKRGKGAFLNGKRIHCSRISNFSVSAGIGPTWLRPRAVRFMTRLLKHSKNKHVMFNGYGSIAVDAAYMSAGRRDWFAAFGAHLHDYAPISLLMQESGCKITNTKGEPWTFKDREIVAANPHLHKELLKLTKNI